MGWGATILDPTGTRLTPEEKALFRATDPFGFILFARNIETAEQTRALCDDLREAVGRPAPILLDQEGGRVQRLRPPLATDWTAPLDFAARAMAAGGLEAAEEAMRLRYAITAAEMRALGIDVNCAPLVDVAGPDTHPFLRDRCYAQDPAGTARLGRAVAQGLMRGGVLPVVKHIPGHGRAQADSHLELPRVSAPLDALEQVDFAPFQVLNDLPMAMTAHVVYDAIDPALAATLSQQVMQVIRNRIGFDGLVMTDDLSMKALSGTPDALAVAALDAGCDVALLCNADLATRARTAEAAGRLTPPAQARAERVADLLGPAPALDIEAMKAKLSALLNG